MNRPALSLLLLLGGCLGPTAPEVIHFHAPLVPDAPPAAPTSQAGGSLRLRRISSVSSIRDRVAWRSDQAELGYWELERWAEPPVDVLERVVSRMLFEHCGFQRSESPSDPSLDLDLTAFELYRSSEGPRARVVLVARLFERSGGTALLEQTFERTAELTVDGPGPELSAALGNQLVALTSEVAEAVIEALRSRDSAP